MNRVMKTTLVVLLVLIWLPITFESSKSENLMERPYDKPILSDIEFGSLSAGESDIYNFDVLASATQFQLSLNGPAGADFDLFVRRNQQPTTSNYDYSSESLSSDETITVNDPTGGVWYVMVYAYSGSGSYSLTLDVDYPDPDPEPTTSSPPPSTSDSPSSTSSSPGTSAPYLGLEELQSVLLTSFIVSGMILGVIAVLWIIVSQRRKHVN